MKARNNSISKNFILFILASIVFWFLTKLSKEYESTISYPVSYENLPNDKLLQKEPAKEIDIHVKTSGFKIISGKLFPKTIKIDASNLTSKSKTDYFLLLAQQRLAVQRQMNNGVTIDHFIKDSLFFSLGFLSQKKVPVHLNTNLSYQAGYDMEGDMKVSPDSVVISGPEKLIDTVKFVKTILLTRNNLSEPINSELLLESFSKENNIKLNTDKVRVEANVEKFTEGTMKVPFTVINLPEDIVINTFPKEVDLTYKIALSNFNKITSSSFLIECDYKLSANNSLLYLVPKIKQQSNLVKNVKIAPNKIDFVIEK
ncbi:CdaR family protein [Pseudotenacibaculum sp. MALMAid0570]|uniref:CdaR family protein n=1 Tax=Pseudotenacibaculum sp. MALMAid0570 TaxID=3143938 RepID=UPI0032DEE5FC